MTISNLVKISRNFSEWVENAVGKGEIAHYKQFLAQLMSWLGCRVSVCASVRLLTFFFHPFPNDRF